MKFFKKMKDGGPESKVTGYWLAEIKSLFSIVLLHFSDGSREAFHSHAFNSLSWVLKGELNENRLMMSMHRYTPRLLPIWTSRSNMHKVNSVGDTWVLSFRGPWAKTWREYTHENGFITLTHGRKIVA